MLAAAAAIARKQASAPAAKAFHDAAAESASQKPLRKSQTEIPITAQAAVDLDQKPASPAPDAARISAPLTIGFQVASPDP